ncbi:MAG TPA: hypothetical protein VKR32_09275 [Puia sp.]|nr:hypothetical protein [Puia sp.]
MTSKIESLNQAKGLRVGQVLFQDESERFFIKIIDAEYVILGSESDESHLKILTLHSLARDEWYSVESG